MPDTQTPTEPKPVKVGKLTGGCQCGSVRYRIARTTARLNVCHCRDCQRQSGSAFGMSLIVSPSSFDLTKGKLKSFNTVATSGREKTCAFCPACGVRIYNQTQALMAVKAGTLDDTSVLRPAAHYWTKRKQPWVVLPEDLPCYEEI